MQKNIFQIFTPLSFNINKDETTILYSKMAFEGKSF